MVEKMKQEISQLQTVTVPEIHPYSKDRLYPRRKNWFYQLFMAGKYVNIRTGEERVEGSWSDKHVSMTYSNFPTKNYQYDTAFDECDYYNKTKLEGADWEDESPKGYKLDNIWERVKILKQKVEVWRKYKRSTIMRYKKKNGRPTPPPVKSFKLKPKGYR